MNIYIYIHNYYVEMINDSNMFKYYSIYFYLNWCSNHLKYLNLKYDSQTYSNKMIAF